MPLLGREADLALVAKQLELGEVVLVLGAGAAFGCQKRDGTNIKNGRQLAEYLAQRMGQPYNEEPLQEVCAAYIHGLGGESLNRVLADEYRNISPSADLRALFEYSWQRLYTWNIDDSVKAASTKGVQKARFFNGLTDKLSTNSSKNDLDVILLHGDITNPKGGFIFSVEEYNEGVVTGSYPWYHKLAEDYRAFIPVFIGTALNEPILDAELHRARRENTREAGRAFLITPDRPSPMKAAFLQSKGITHLVGTLADFVEFLKESIGARLTPSQILANKLPFSLNDIKSLSTGERASLNYIFPINIQQVRGRLAAYHKHNLGREAKKFLTGFPSTWEIAASDVPIKLAGAAKLTDSLKDAVTKKAGLFAVVGPLASGKSTALMQSLLELGGSGGIEVYEVDIGVPSFADALIALAKLSGKPKVLYVPVLYPVASDMSRVVSLAAKNNILIASSARKSEWSSHLINFYRGKSSTFELERFTSADHAPLIDRLSRYVPAPAFNRLGREAKIKRLAASNQQLLIALREATDSKAFDLLIADEFRALGIGAPRALFILIGVATIARVGIREEMLFESLASRYSEEEVRNALLSLDGIAYKILSGRVFIRHELYVRRVFAESIPFDERLELFIALAEYFTNFKWPITKHVSRPDGTLFRSLFNHDNLRNQVKTLAEKILGIQLYEQLEVPLQFDGHFWLQYGLYLADLGRLDEAIEKLERSLQAYSENNYARHTLAALQLRYASKMPEYNSAAQKMEFEAVNTLRELEARGDLKTETYPLVTLTLLHTALHIHLGQADEARKLAERYLAEVQRSQRSSADPALGAVKETLLKFLTLDRWEPPKFQSGVFTDS